MKKLSEIYKLKGSKTAILLACGTSIGRITDEQWKIIAKHDSFAINNFLYHPFVPTFYHAEVKWHDKDIWKKRKDMKGDTYKDVNFIINKKRTDVMFDVIGEYGNLFGYDMHKINIHKRPIVTKYTPHKNPNVLTCNLNASITMLFDILYKFKYKRVILFGVDLMDSKYFWTDKPEYGEVHAQFNYDGAGKKVPTDPHNVSHIQNFLVWFANKKMKEVGGKIYVGHKLTALYPEIEYMALEDL